LHAFEIGHRASTAPLAVLKEEGKGYAGKYQSAFRKGSQLALTLARAPLKIEKREATETMRIRRVVSHAIRPAPSSPLEASRSTSTNPPLRSFTITVVVVECILLFIAWQ